VKSVNYDGTCTGGMKPIFSTPTGEKDLTCAPLLTVTTSYASNAMFGCFTNAVTAFMFSVMT
jgi:hypothetical protein